MIAAPFLRPWHGRWGATDAELRQFLPGDDTLPCAQVRWTRAITIGAPPKEVWPWLVQVGYDKAGFYSNDLLDRLGRPSADDLHQEWQNARIGDWIAMAANPTDKTAFRVAGFEEPHWLLWKKPDSTWSWRLTPSGDARTRLVTRLQVHYDWSQPTSALLSVLLIEFGDYAMIRRMLLGVKKRAERHQTQTCT